MFGSIAGRYDITNSVLSFGIHHLWKKDFIRSIRLPHGIKALDLACGTGDLVPLIAAQFGDAVTGGDFCEPMLEVARQRFGPKYSFMLSDAMQLPFADASFDLVTISFGVRNFENLRRGLREIYRVLKPGGVIAVLEFGQPDNALFAWIYRWYSRNLMPWIGGLLTGNRDAYEYLPQTAAQFPCGEKFLQELSVCGFKDSVLRRYTLGIAYGYQGKR